MGRGWGPLWEGPLVVCALCRFAQLQVAEWSLDLLELIDDFATEKPPINQTPNPQTPAPLHMSQCGRIGSNMTCFFGGKKS